MTDANYPVNVPEMAASRKPRVRSVSRGRLRHSSPGQRTNRREDILAQLSSDDCALMLSKCSEVKYPRGAHLFVQGSSHIGNFFIRSGVVRTYYVSPTGKELTLAYWSVGDLVGGPDLFNSKIKHVWSAQAVEDTSALVIDGEDFFDIAIEIPKLPSLARAVINTLMFKLRWMSILLQLQGTASVSVRLAHLLLKLSEMFGREHSEGTIIEHRFTQDDLATMIGATRQWLSVTLNQLRRQGIVKFENRQLIILDHDALRWMSKI